MRILLINVAGQLSSDGSRLISALLKRANHRVQTVFLARLEPLEYSLKELEALDDLISEAGLVLLAVYSFYAFRAVQITNYIHQRYPGLLVIWGGPHCISAPELSLQYADGVCFSEGDQAVVDLVNRIANQENYLSTPNMAFNVNGNSVINPVLRPFTDLDGLPNYDYDLEDHFLLDRSLFPISKKIFQERSAGYPYYVPILYLITTRGCPHNCSYCNNCRYLAMFGRNRLRFYSLGRILGEMEQILTHFDFFQLIGFGDDDFFFRPKQEIREFAEQYKKRIGLPFGIAISATTYKKEKLNLLLSAGLKVVQMGVQSGSQRVLDEVYHRRIKVSKTKDVVGQIAPLLKSKQLDLLLDFIIDNPFENPDDIIQTYNYLVELPFEVKANFFYLAFFPGTPIYDRALQELIIKPYSEQGFRFFTRGQIRYQRNYEMFLVLLVRYIQRHPRWRFVLRRSLLRTLGRNWARGIAAAFPASFYDRLIKKIQ